jgi:hypothetical protein
MAQTSGKPVIHSQLRRRSDSHLPLSEISQYTVTVLATRPIWIALLYAVCIVSGAFSGLLASAMIVRASAGPNCCAPGDGIGMFLVAIPLVPLGAVLGLVLVATVLRISRRQAAHH